jgi:hypothetical protein
LANYLLALRLQNPNLRLVLWHSSRQLNSGGYVYPSCTSRGLDQSALSLAQRYADVTGYTIMDDWSPYKPTGELINWCAEESITAIDVVIPRSLSGFDRNLRNTTMGALLEIARFP